MNKRAPAAGHGRKPVRPLDRKAFAIARKAVAEATRLSRQDIASFLLHKGWEQDASPDGVVRFKLPARHGTRLILMTTAPVNQWGEEREARLAIQIAGDVYGYDELEMRLRIAEDRARRRDLEIFETGRRKTEVEG
ncbi:hypothetical protein [Rhizobium leguminosarum]|uniref:hypothetical protein n=1 Tax=Rhizobium leguminosarum TaxID=384 RepID=UPI002E150B93|nr:hypothetical protein U8Q02_43460 [Rhizobium leguminosarum]